MENFVNKLVLIYFTALGILMGASMVGSLAAVLVKQPPMVTMLKLARDVKIWAIAAAIGGTFSTFEVFGSGLFQGDVRAVLKQMLYIVSALAGTETAYYLIMLLCGNKS